MNLHQVQESTEKHRETTNKFQETLQRPSLLVKLGKNQQSSFILCPMPTEHYEIHSQCINLNHSKVEVHRGGTILLNTKWLQESKKGDFSVTACSAYTPTAKRNSVLCTNTSSTGYCWRRDVGHKGPIDWSHMTVLYVCVFNHIIKTFCHYTY